MNPFNPNNPPATVREVATQARDLHQTVERIARRALRRAKEAGQTDVEIDNSDAVELTTALNRVPSWAVNECRVPQPDIQDMDPDEMLAYAKVCSATSTAYTAGLIAGAWIAMESHELETKGKKQLAELSLSILLASAFELTGRALRLRELDDNEAKACALDAAERAAQEAERDSWMFDGTSGQGGAL